MSDESSEKPSDLPATAEKSAPAGPSTAAVDDVSPEAIARRVAALGGDDETERLADDEEQKLAARRAETKAARKASGGAGAAGGGARLEAAASKRLAAIGNKNPVRRSAPAVARDARRRRVENPFVAWAKENPRTLASLIGAVLVAGAGTAGYFGWQQSRDTNASTLFTQALDDEHGRIGDPAKEEDEGRAKDPRPVFKTVEDRRAKALAELRDVQSKYRGTGASYLARLEEAGLLLDQRDAKGARAALEEVAASPLGKVDTEVRGRALEGLGFSYELDAAADEANRDKHLDAAIKAFHDLELVDGHGWKELGLYHQARCYEAKGDTAKAIEQLKAVYEKVSKPGDSKAFPYLGEVAQDRLRLLDPNAIPAKAPVGQPSAGGAGAANSKMTDEQIQKIIEQMKQQQLQRASQPGSAGTPPMPPLPMNPPPEPTK